MVQVDLNALLSGYIYSGFAIAVGVRDLVIGMETRAGEDARTTAGLETGAITGKMGQFGLDFATFWGKKGPKTAKKGPKLASSSYLSVNYVYLYSTHS